MTDNPLQDYFRTKEIYIRLPTEGIYFTDPVNFNSDGEIGIMPMNSKDETLLKIPDTLFSGESLYTIIKSIAPDIPNPYELTIPDLDVILLATRSVTYGGEMSMNAKCPKCGKTHEYQIEIKNLLSMIRPTPKNVEVEIQGLLIRMKPNTVKVVTARGISEIKSKQIAVAMAQKTKEDVENSDVSIDQYREMFEQSLNEITAAETAIIADSIESVTKPDGTVITDINHIVEWLSNSNSTIYERLKKYSAEQNKNGLPSTLSFTCADEKCNNKFNSILDLNPTFFFINR